MLQVIEVYATVLQCVKRVYVDQERKVLRGK